MELKKNFFLTRCVTLFGFWLAVIPPSVSAANTFVTISDFELWSNTYKSEQIRISTTGIQNPELCTDPDSYMVDTTLPAEVKGRIYSTLLAAALAKKPVRIVIDGCEWNRPRVVSVLIK